MSTAKKWGLKHDWTPREKNLLVTNTDQFGEWIILKKEEGFSVLTKANEKRQIQVRYNHLNCKSELSVIKNSKERQEDQKLKNLISKGKGIIYLWSPNMPLSIKGLDEIKKATKEAGLKLIVFLVEGSEGNNLTMISKKDQNTISSFDLKMRNAYLHFPTLLSFKNGKIQNNIKYGYENKDGYKKDFKDIFKF